MPATGSELAQSQRLNSQTAAAMATRADKGGNDRGTTARLGLLSVWLGLLSVLSLSFPPFDCGILLCSERKGLRQKVRAEVHLLLVFSLLYEAALHDASLIVVAFALFILCLCVV